MGEPRPLIESHAGDPLAVLVRHAAELRVEYDVEAGAARHDRLVARLEVPSGAPMAAAKPWSAWGLASVIVVAAVAAGLAGGRPEPEERERRESARVVASDRAGSRAPSGVDDAPRRSPEPTPPEPTSGHGRDRDAPGPMPAERAPTRAGVEQAPPAAGSPVRARGSTREGVTASGRAPFAPREATAAPPADTRDDRIEREAAQIRTIRTALGRGDAEAALSHCDEGDREHPEGVFEAERQGLRVLALVELGRLEAARPLAARYLAANPSGSLAPRIRRAIEHETR